VRCLGDLRWGGEVSTRSWGSDWKRLDAWGEIDAEPGGASLGVDPRRNPFRKSFQSPTVDATFEKMRRMRADWFLIGEDAGSQKAFVGSGCCSCALRGAPDPV